MNHHVMGAITLYDYQYKSRHAGNINKPILGFYIYIILKQVFNVIVFPHPLVSSLFNDIAALGDSP